MARYPEGEFEAAQSENRKEGTFRLTKSMCVIINK